MERSKIFQGSIRSVPFVHIENVTLVINYKVNLEKSKPYFTYAKNEHNDIFL